MNIVWFKKDLRSQDHQALAAAVAEGPTVGLFIFEPEWFLSPEFDLKHLQFALECLQELEISLAQKGIPLIYRQGSAVQVFSELHRQRKIRKIFSHQETGLLWTFQRDLAVKEWSQSQGLPWLEFKQFGVIRKLQDRDTWQAKRNKILLRPLVTVPGQPTVICPWDKGQLPLDKIPKPNSSLQKGGRKAAEKYLGSFLSARGLNYMASLSSPVKAFDGCSRISPYLTWGCISLTETTAAIRKKYKNLQLEPPDTVFRWKKSLHQFESRLWWHCHFIQKLETEPAIEFENFNRKFDGMRESSFDEAKFQAWCKGETGFPLVDACMRALLQHGWINFRMRAMLVSFASYQLWLHWKKPAEFLARQFLDFEPGIHYSQMQMQSGVTGINTIRIYSPKKQLLEQDPEGLFIRKYVPELSEVPLSDLADPYQMPPLLRLESQLHQERRYPMPIVDPEKSYQEAKEKIFQWKKDPEVKKLSQKVLEKHGSRRGEHFPRQKRD